MADAPSIDDMLRRAFAGVDDDDVRLFYRYFEELKRHARRYLSRQARQFPGESNVAQSALVSLFCDLSLQQVPLQEKDEHGYPMLWPLLLQYVERHCAKWKKYYRAKKRQGHEVPLADGPPALEPPDYRSPPGDEEAVVAALATLYGRLTLRQRRVAELSAQGRTLEEIAAALGCSQSLVSLEKKAIRTALAAP